VTLINEKGPLKRGSSCCSWQPDACFADEEDKIDVDEWQQKVVTGEIARVFGGGRADGLAELARPGAEWR
jgi:hypothetical protein